MTDAAVPITQVAVERFAEQYLTSIGCSIEKRGDRWDVTVPDRASTELPVGRFVLRCGDGPAESDDNVDRLHPESSFFRRLVTEASERAPVGKITVDSTDTEVELPDWATESGVSVSDATFTPYYDRTAAVVLFRISIETVSEYQSELLWTHAFDVRSMDPLPALEASFLELTSPDAGAIECEPLEMDSDDVSRLIDDTRERVVERVQPRIDQIHRDASRAAEREVEEYRRMQQQRIEELEVQLSNLSRRIDELSDSIQGSSDQSQRVRSLKKRKELKSEYEDIESEAAEIRRRRDRGFPEKQREIRNRHALEVVVTPLTFTQVDYERGELEMVLVDESATRTLTVGYGSGIGDMENITCDSCNRPLSEQNTLQTIEGGLRCKTCTTGE